MNETIRFEDVAENGPLERHAVVKLTPEELEREEVASPAEVTLDVRVEPGQETGEFVVSGNASFQTDLTCSRCLEPYPFANKSDFTVRYRPYPAATEEEEEVEIPDGELDVAWYDEPVLSLKDLAADAIQLAIPMKPLCIETCQGLCPDCGANRNQESCSCAGKATDERWQALSGIREQLRKKNEN
jgi:uncharacterized protein